MNRKTLTALFACLAVLLVSLGVSRRAFAATSSNPDVARIQTSGVLRVGVKQDVPNFGYYNAATNTYEGMEIDIAKKIAKNMGVRVEFTPVTPQTREAMLDNGQIDLLIATYTITDVRKQSFAISEPYYVDEIGFLVGRNSDIHSISDLNNKTIGVPQGATTKAAIQAYAKAHNLKVNFVELGTYSELAISLYAHRVDAISTDKAILSGYVSKQARILDQGFNTEDYGIVAKKSNTQLISYVNNLLNDWRADGSLAKIYNQYGLKPATSEND